jgi:hypothetical protein
MTAGPGAPGLAPRPPRAGWPLRLLVAALSLGCAAPATGQNADSLAYIGWSLEPWARDALRADPAGARLDVFLGLNPFYQRGDFDGDGQTDVAVQVVDRTTHKRGIAFVHRADRSVHVVGAGRTLGNGGDDFSWLWVWRVARPDHLRPRLPGTREALLVEKPEAASGWILWSGRRYVWVQGGD